jgi:AraC family transcriptional regulator of adaptative response / DNA-3-methyladenine glycosylase II
MIASIFFMAPSIAARPGLRVPGAFDPFELAVRAILGQQVTVRAATTLSGRLVERFGTRVEHGLEGASSRFPRPDELARESEDGLASIGLPGARARTILALSRALASGDLELSTRADPEATITRLDALPGIGPWTANYIAMRALSWANAFPAEDLAVKKALGLTRPRALVARAEAWAPWRAYAVMHLWAGTPTSGG